MRRAVYSATMASRSLLDVFTHWLSSQPSGSHVTSRTRLKRQPSSISSALPAVGSAKNELGPFMLVPVGTNCTPSGSNTVPCSTSNCPVAGRWANGRGEAPAPALAASRGAAGSARARLGGAAQAAATPARATTAAAFPHRPSVRRRVKSSLSRLAAEIRRGDHRHVGGRTRVRLPGVGRRGGARTGTMGRCLVPPAAGYSLQVHRVRRGGGRGDERSPDRVPRRDDG